VTVPVHSFVRIPLSYWRFGLLEKWLLVVNAAAIPKTKPRCPICGAAVTSGSSYCVKCVPLVNRDNLLQQAKLGRIATHSASAEARRSATQAKQAQALRKWNPSDLMA
jgi:hypothetical protein